jgi:hypothetical protein
MYLLTHIYSLAAFFVPPFARALVDDVFAGARFLAAPLLAAFGFACRGRFGAARSGTITIGDGFSVT